MSSSGSGQDREWLLHDFPGIRGILCYLMSSTDFFTLHSFTNIIELSGDGLVGEDKVTHIERWRGLEGMELHS